MSRFVSAGAINAETGEAVAATEPKAGDAGETRKNTEWEAVQKELEAERKRREDARVKAVEGGEQSLYDILQANKAAKQAAFEEANKIKNQFRPLDDDEIDFLDEVRESARAAEERVRRETEEGLAAFRKAQNQKRPVEGEDGGDEGGAGAAVEGGDEEWAVGPRKRRRKETKGLGVKREKSGEQEVKKSAAAKDEEKAEVKDSEKKVGEVKVADVGERKASEGGVAAKPKTGLVAYGSDSDDDD
ncbi:uncharacterized protein CTRU02_208231 [Colletotrichum truncatum]|uniref:Uncharacterized protein n=1 Tax=Colletotrichum truncatum TaxID=5467 RepID=A0ACC3YVQ1_COLTU|nr:uncharacterized protein CTRU02_07589 [Colletotrichum truncatum]KAF6791249.1 hypothetical protein CTRU02_07589 [Colletotrichum truncatum]